MSLRLRLLLLILLILLPAAGLLVYTALEQRRAATEEARNSAVRLAIAASNSQQQLIELSRQLLAALAALPDARERDPAKCNVLVSRLLREYPRYANLGAATRGGDVFCSAVPLREPTNIADRGYFLRAVGMRDFAVGDYQIGRVTGKASVNFGYPILGDTGEVVAVVFAAFDLGWLNQLVAEFRLPPGSVVMVLDRSGLVLARYPASGEAPGTSVEPNLLRLILGQRDAGTAEAPGPGSAPYLYAFAPLRHREGVAAYVSVGLSKAVIYADADRLLQRNLVILSVVAALTLLTAWIVGNLAIVRRVRPLVKAAERLSRGDLGARAGVRRGRGELSQLARAFDEMAASLQQAEERRSLEEELRRKNYELEQQNRAVQEANRLKGEFVSMVSHELRTPLTSIQGYVELLLERGRLPFTEEQRESLTIVRDNAYRLLGLINDLLDLSRIEAGRIELHRASLDLGALIQEVAGSLRPLIEAKRQRLTLELDSALPALWADADRVRQILTNLIANAHKYTPVGGSITVRTRLEGGYVRVDVRDTGVGLSAEEQAQLFTRFFQAKRPGGDGAVGTGLGLVITRLLVELHGGAITVTSAPGEGSTFGFSLPVSAKDPATAQPG